MKGQYADSLAPSPRSQGSVPHTLRFLGARGQVWLKQEYDFKLGHYQHGGPRDFSERSQDELALQLLREKSVLPLIWDDQLQGAFSMLNRTWNSLPGGGCQLVNEKDAETYFRQKLGEYRNETFAPPRGNGVVHDLGLHGERR